MWSFKSRNVFKFIDCQTGASEDKGKFRVEEQTRNRHADLQTRTLANLCANGNLFLEVNHDETPAITWSGSNRPRKSRTPKTWNEPNKSIVSMFCYLRSLTSRNPAAAAAAAFVAVFAQKNERDAHSGAARGETAGRSPCVDASRKRQNNNYL